MGFFLGIPPGFPAHYNFTFTFQRLVFNSLTSCLGPRRLLHSGRLYKTKSTRELWAFLFNDFLLLTHGAKALSSSGQDRLFGLKSNIQLKMYKTVSEEAASRGTNACVSALIGGITSCF